VNKEHGVVCVVLNQSEEMDGMLIQLLVVVVVVVVEEALFPLPLLLDLLVLVLFQLLVLNQVPEVEVEVGAQLQPALVSMFVLVLLRVAESFEFFLLVHLLLQPVRPQELGSRFPLLSADGSVPLT